MTIAFTRVRLPFGWLGNMSPHPVAHGGKTWPTAEHLFQALRFGDGPIREAIRAERNPFAAKLLAKANAARMAGTPCGRQDLENMEQVLRLKLDQHAELRERLLATGAEEIVEDCTRRPHGNALFWGAALRGGPGSARTGWAGCGCGCGRNWPGPTGRRRPRRDLRGSAFDCTREDLQT